MPARIEEKANNGPKRWNTWALNEHSSFTAPPAPEFLPAADGPVIAPGSRTMIVMSTPRPHPRAHPRRSNRPSRKRRGRRGRRGEPSLS
ncbi:unnamed protein product [Aureobasidium pullulans]|nr:unnamed protein product [Aureobasidium pullulans]